MNLKGNHSCFYFTLSPKGETSKKVAFSSRFINDKVNYEDDNIIVLADGVLLNKSELIPSISPTLKDYYSQCLESPNLIRNLRGPFVVLVYDKVKKKGITFGNQTGDASVFYAFDKYNNLCISNDFNALSDSLGKFGRIDYNASHHLLTYGYFVDDSTILNNIKKVQAGKLLRFGDSIEIERYHRFNFHDKINITLSDAVEKLDVLFRRAVRRCFDKDVEYGYDQHLADLSAGLDSRMVNVVAKDMGYTGIVNISYAQSSSTEAKMTINLSNALKFPLFFRKLDDALFLYDINDIVKENYGMAYYCGITGGRQFLQLVDFKRFGLEHTGQLGDVVISSFLQKNSSKIEFNEKRNSNLLPLRVIPDVKEYKSQEEFLSYTRGFQGALATHYIRSNYTYAVSPFLDVDLYEFCASLPDEIRAMHKLYWNWIDRKYPIYSKIPSSRLRMYEGMQLKDKYLMYNFRIKGRLKRDGYRIAKYIGLSETGTSPDHMNPHTYWYEKNQQLRSFINNYFNENICLLDGMPEIKDDTIKMFASKSALDKLMAISLLSTVKHYCEI